MRAKWVAVSFLVILTVGVVSWLVFFAGKRGKMEIVQENQEKAQEEQTVGEKVPVEENISQEEVVEKSPEQIVDQFKEQQQKPTETVIKPEEIIKAPAEKKTFSLGIKDRLVSSGFQRYGGERKVDTVIIHSSYNSLGGDQYDVEKIIGIYKSYGVSAHYIIGRDGTVYRLVKDNDIAYHAGVSKVPDGRTDVNKFSIGIEMVGNKTDGYEDEQYSAVSALVEKIKNDYAIKYVLGHDDIAPGRKDDPWKFDFNKLK